MTPIDQNIEQLIVAPEKGTHIYFIGIGGIGMSALARYFLARGCVVSGYDKTETALTKKLVEEGIRVHYVDDINLFDHKASLVIYTPAVPGNHIGLQYASRDGFRLLKRSEVLGVLSRNSFNISVGGSHGKTTVTSMIAWILKHSEYDCTAFLGGICTNFQSNFVAGENDVTVTEADEFDRSFLRLSPDISVITAVDSDHLEIYGSQREIENAFIEFANKTSASGQVIVKFGLPIQAFITIPVHTYALDDARADLYVQEYSVSEEGSKVLLNNGMRYTLQYHGVHNIENSVAAASVALLLGISADAIADALNTFKGIYRRFDVQVRNAKTVYIDDYAHHPEEIKMFLGSVRKIYPGRQITAIFQPHLFTRTRDLADGFARSLEAADEIILLPIYPAREQPIPGVTSEIIAERMHTKHVQVMSKEALIEHIKTTPMHIVCTIGAGDIDNLVQPIARILEKA
ncbi:MAG: UDP-N-acetylmuramate--L-alanine ligase [Chitinophagales bacterium]